MTRCATQSRFVLAALVLAAGFAAAQVQPTIINLGILPGSTYSVANAVSADGSTVVGECATPTGLRAFRWTRAGGMVSLGVLPGAMTSTASSVSADGAAAAGSTPDSPLRPFAWRTTGGLQGLGVFSGGYEALATGISSDGQVIVGYGDVSDFTVRAFRSSGGGLVSLGLPQDAIHSYASAASANGSVIVGWSADETTIHAFRWAANTFQDLGILPGQTFARAVAISADGAVVAGVCDSRSFRWTAETGIQDIGLVSGQAYSAATAISADGSTIVGAGAASPAAFLWTSTLGSVNLNTWLPTVGVNLTGWVLLSATGVSADGTTIVGTGTFNGQQRAFLVTLDPDTDGDGLRDSWETLGVPYKDSNGQDQRFPLPGADRMHKDLYVEADAMNGRSLTTAAANAVVAAFAQAPVSNPDQTSGITLHILRDQTNLPPITFWPTDGCWPFTFDQYRAANFGTAAERADASAVPLLEAKAKAYRYCIIANRALPDSIGGCGLVKGDSFVAFTGIARNTNDEASIFMHELGHNLGLQHGGGDEINGKPNYPSIMNYTLSYPQQWNQAFWKLDFSRAGSSLLASLNESTLNETAGVGSAGGLYSGYSMPFGVNVDSRSGPVRRARYVKLDGSPTDFGNVAGTGFTDGLFTISVVQDLNYAVDATAGVSIPCEASPGELLRAHDDWANIRLILAAAIGTAAPAATIPSGELTEQGRDWMSANFPLPGPTCYADCDHVGGLTGNDFQCFLNAFVSAASYADCDGVGGLTGNDFQCFLNRFVAGCS